MKPSNTKQIPQENILGALPAPVVLLKTTLPMLVSMIASTLYNLVDSIFVSHVCEEALTALTLSAPLQMLVTSSGCGIAIGLNANASKALGENRPQKAADFVTSAMFLSICAYAALVLICLFGLKPFFLWQSGGDMKIAQYGMDYMRICLLFSFGHLSQWVFDRLLITTGKSAYLLYTLSTAAIINLILDPILIFGWFGLPAMETTGAAIATVIGQIGGGIVALILNLRRNKEIPIRFSLRPDGSSIMPILKIGIPTFITHCMSSVIGIGMNTILLGFSSTAVAVSGACNRIRSLATVCTSGIGNSVIPLVAYNYGARNKSRVYDSIKWSILYGCGFAVFAFAVVQLFPVQILGMFDASEEMLRIGIPALRILSFVYVLSAISHVFTCTYQALGKGTYELITSTIRTILPLMLSWLFAQLGNLNLVWSTSLMVEILILPVIVYLFHKIRVQILEKL